METGHVVEYIDRQRIMCAVILDIKKQRLRLLNENNREISLSASRLSRICHLRLDSSMGRDRLVEMLQEIATRRKALIEKIDIRELWEVLSSEQEWIDLETMTEFCFPETPTEDHESAVVRAFFENRRYFRFNHDRFFPYTEEQVERMAAQAREAARRDRMIEQGGEWIRQMLSLSERQTAPPLSHQAAEYCDILKSYYIFDKESKHVALARAMLGKAGITNPATIFNILVRAGIFEPDENIDLIRYGVFSEFSADLLAGAQKMADSSPTIHSDNRRRDLTELPLMTIDGQATLDYDDALSLERKHDHCLIGIHIADVSHFIRNGDAIDLEAMARGSSIYMPDQKIPMLPPSLAEGLCSLKAGHVRPAISIMARVSAMAEILDYEVFPSVIRVASQLTYFDVNTVADEHPDIIILHDIAKKFREKRLAAGAVQISLPDVNVWLGREGEVNVSKINRESPGRLLVSELMIMANWLMARFLAKHQLPGIYRSQPAPKERLYEGDGGTLFQNWMQRKHLNRFMLGPAPEHHSGLGLDCYTTATSPIRKYFDLVTQRQLHAVFGMETPYSIDEITRIIQLLEQPMMSVGRVQYGRNRYWILKYLEKRVGQREEAIVLYRRKNGYVVLITNYLLECELPLSGNANLKPEDLIQVTIQNVNARKDRLSVFMG